MMPTSQGISAPKKPIYDDFQEVLKLQPSADGGSLNRFLLRLTQNQVTTYASQPIDEIESKVDALGSWGSGWNGNDVEAPRKDSIERAQKWIRRMYADVSDAQLKWLDPHISANEDGFVTFEWWYDQRSLTVYVESTHAWHIRAWGSDVLEDMSDGTADSVEERKDMWIWLVG